jgi:hypothetical protein
MKSELSTGINIGSQERSHQPATRLLACLCLMVIALTCGHTAVAQQTNQSASDYQHRQNVSACEFGWVPCNEALLTPAEAVRLAEIRHQQNVSACESGWRACDGGQLTPAEIAHLAVVRHRQYVAACVGGWGPCDNGQLTPSEAAQLAVVRHRQNVLSTPVTAPVAENGSYYGELNANGVPKTVSVQGYTRSDGTYVRGYYRSAPGTNPAR